MSALMPETIEPATGTLPLPRPSKTRRKAWTGTQIALMVHAHVSGLALGWPDSGHTEAECVAKLIELGIIPKPEKVTLTRAVQSQADHALAYFEDMPEGQRTLAIRYAIKALTALLPKRSK